MKKLLLLIAFLPTIFSCEAIWNHDGPTQLLMDIFKIARVKNTNTIEAAIKRTSSWIRPKFMERWHAYKVLDKGQRVELIKLIKHSDLAMVKLPKLNHYNIVVILGGATARAEIRVDLLIKLAKEGITFDKIYLFGSTRNLKDGSNEDKKIVPILKEKNSKIEEIAMVEYLWQQATKPESLEFLPVSIFKAGKKPDGTRAGLAETLSIMIKNTEIAKGTSFLFISNNPYICFHDAIAKRILKPYKVSVETVGAAMGEDTAENILDSVARCLINIDPEI